MHYKEFPHMAVERFHGEFLRALADVVDPGLFVVKGGVNLRLCLGSVRCSEDLDIDVHKVAVGTLKKQVDKLFEVRLKQVLKPFGFSITEYSTPKQTDVVQRWKATLLVGASPINTKVEFSRRGLGDGIERNLIDASICAVHQMPPFAIPHYSAAAAARQKVKALVGRATPQSRDVFDLHYLFALGNDPAIQDMSSQELTVAAENCIGISYNEFRGQVANFLPREHQATYDSEVVWNQMQEQVLDILQKAAEAAKAREAQ